MKKMIKADQKIAVLEVPNGSLKKNEPGLQIKVKNRSIDMKLSNMALDCIENSCKNTISRHFCY